MTILLSLREIIENGLIVTSPNWAAKCMVRMAAQFKRRCR
jgi:hypothetical protein